MFFQRKSKAMSEEVEMLRSRCESLEARKRTEAQGYQADVGILHQKIRQIEQQLVKADLARAKGKEGVFSDICGPS